MPYKDMYLQIVKKNPYKFNLQKVIVYLVCLIHCSLIGIPKGVTRHLCGYWHNEEVMFNIFHSVMPNKMVNKAL